MRSLLVEKFVNFLKDIKTFQLEKVSDWIDTMVDNLVEF